jgi:hypothetical protein
MTARRSAQADTARRDIAAAMGQIDALLPGSIVVRHVRCGKANCACQADPPRLHGPYIQWTRTVDGKTVTRFLSEEQLTRYRPWFDNARRLRELIAKLEIASVHALEAESRTARTASKTGPLGTALGLITPSGSSNPGLRRQATVTVAGPRRTKSLLSSRTEARVSSLQESRAPISTIEARRAPQAARTSVRCRRSWL